MVALNLLEARFKKDPVNPSIFKLPKFSGDETEELGKFMESFFRFLIPSSYYVQIYIIIAVVSTLILWGVLIIMKQIYERKFWIFRSQQTSSNIKLLVPNSTASFILFEGIFAITWFGYTFFSRAIDEGHADPKGRAAFMLLAWLPLVIGALGASWGSFFLCPGILSRTQSGGGRFNVSRFIPSAFILNILCVGFPLIFTIVISFIASKAGGKWEEALDLWRKLDGELKLQRSGPISIDQTADAIEIWNLWSQAFWWISAGFLTFCCVASTIFLFYTSASLFLISQINSQITAAGFVFGGFRSLTKTTQGQTPGWNADERAAAEEEERAVQSTFYPPVKNPENKMAKAKTSSQRAEVLRSALINIIIMSLSINVAVLGYVANTMFISLRVYEASIASPQELTKVYITYNLIAGWLAAVFGSISFSNIFLNTYQTFFDNMVESKTRSRTGTRSKEILELKGRAAETPAKDLASNSNEVDTFGNVKSNEEMNEGLEAQDGHDYSEEKFQTSSTGRYLNPQKSFGAMSTASEGFVQRDDSFLSESFFNPTNTAFSFNPTHNSEAAQMESVFEGEGIDSMIGSPDHIHESRSSSRDFLNVKNKSQEPEENLRDEKEGFRHQSIDQSQSRNSFSIDDHQQQRWESNKWTTPEVWDPQKMTSDDGKL